MREEDQIQANETLGAKAEKHVSAETTNFVLKIGTVATTTGTPLVLGERQRFSSVVRY